MASPLIFTDPRCLRHRSPGGMPETPARLEAVLRAAAERGLEIREGASEAVKAAAQELVPRVHDPVYLERFRRAVERGDGLLDSADNPLSAGTWDAAWGAVEAGLAAAEVLVTAGPESGPRPALFAAVRPPGHHVERATAMGFCYIANVAVMAEYLLREGLERVAIFDFDVHHGNGTQHIFEDRADVLYASTHQWPFYPGTGAASEQGRGAGVGATVNVPLAAGTGDEDFFEQVEEHIYGAIRAFQPDALLISAGFDAWREDPLGGLALSLEAFRRLGRDLGALAGELCGGRMASILEGGYDVDRLGDLVLAYLDGCSEAAKVP